MRNPSLPDAGGHYDIFGGRYVPEALVAALNQLEAEFDVAMGDSAFWRELDDLRRKYESFRSELGLNPTTDSGMAYLKRAHTQYLPEIVMNSDTPSDPIAADTESGVMT